MPSVWVEHFKRQLLGMPLSHIWIGSSAEEFFLEFGTLGPDVSAMDQRLGVRNGEISLAVLGGWRMEHRGQILARSHQDPTVVTRRLGNIVGLRVERLSFTPAPSEVCVEFSHGWRFMTFKMAQMAPGWTLIDRSVTPETWLQVSNGHMRKCTATRGVADDDEPDPIFPVKRYLN